ncbi:MAG: ArnT family glycosyltransferase [Phycisphaerae bacterium]
MANESDKRRAWGTWVTGWGAALVVILLAYGVGLWGSTFSSATFDEGAHLVGGYLHWTVGQARIHTENGRLSQAVASLPLLLMKLHGVDTTSAAWKSADVFLLGREFLYLRGNDAGWMLFWGRAAIGVLMGVTGAVVYGWSRKLFGRGAALFSCAVFCFSPLVLAHGFLATSDMAATCFFVLSLAGFWWAVRRGGWWRIGLSGVAMAGLFLAKMSGPVILPVVGGMIVVDVWADWRRKDLADGPPRGVGPTWRLLRDVGILFVHGVVVWIVIWGAYGFHYSALRDSAAGSGETLHPDDWGWAMQNPTAGLEAVRWARDHRVLPEAYLYGYAYVAQTQRVVVSYVNGERSRAGWWWFYPYVFWLTTPIAVMVAMGLSVAAVVRWGRKAERRVLRERLVEAAPLVIFVVVYWGAAIASYRGSGPRHLLPAYPVLCILLGAAWWWVRRARWGRVALAGVVGWVVVEAALVFPYFLSYFNEIGGGPRKGYTHFVDSAVDWGQGLPAVAGFLKAHPEEGAVYLSYFGSADPGYYGIRAIALPSFIRQRGEDEAATYAHTLGPGTYLVSVTQLAGLYQDWGRYTPQLEKGYEEGRRVYPMLDRLLADPRVTGEYRARLLGLPQQMRYYETARLFAYLRARGADGQLADSINVYRLSGEEMDRALNGPPVYEGERVEMK